MNNLVKKQNFVSFGNKKLPKSTMIFNMGTAFKCPSDSLGLCQLSKICYAKKAELMYKQVVPYRENQAQIWTNNDKYSMFEILKSQLKKTTKQIRINESGDFYTQDCVDKLEFIALKMNELGIKVYCYTARKDLNFENCVNLVVNGSNFTKSGISNVFKPVRNYSDNELNCKGDCKICNLCATITGRIIQVKIH